MSIGQVIDAPGSIHNGAPKARSIQFFIEATSIVVHAEFGCGDGGLLKFAFDVEAGRCPVIDLRGWKSVRFWIEEDQGDQFNLRVFWRSATLPTEGLVKYERYIDDTGDGVVDGRYVPQGAVSFESDKDDTIVWSSAVFGNAFGLYSQAIKAYVKYPVRGLNFIPTLEANVVWFLKV